MASTEIKAYGNPSADTPLQPITINRRELQPHDVSIDILYCGVCHSDLHQARNEWSDTVYPCVPGHEIVGRVTHVGAQVTRFKTGDLAAIGCLTESCQSCDACAHDMQQFCEKGATFTYNSRDPYLGGHAFGGYAEKIVAHENFVLRVPPNLNLAGAAPLLCAGITTYSPLKRWKAGPGKKVGVIGIGGLGHVAIKIAHAMGATVVAITQSASKAAEARRLGADEVIISTDKDQMKKHRKSFHLIIDTVAARHDINAYLALVKLDGTLVLVGLPDQELGLDAFRIVFPRRILTGSAIGGIAETQEMLDFCAQHAITADIELIRMDQINEAYERLLKSDVRYRFVIDMASIKS